MQIEKTWEIATVVSPSSPTPFSIALLDSLAVCESRSSRSQGRRLVLATNLAACQSRIGKEYLLHDVILLYLHQTDVG
jgi:hypothetical protein